MKSKHFYFRYHLEQIIRERAHKLYGEPSGRWVVEKIRNPIGRFECEWDDLHLIHFRYVTRFELVDQFQRQIWVKRMFR